MIPDVQSPDLLAIGGTHGDAHAGPQLNGRLPVSAADVYKAAARRRRLLAGSGISSTPAPRTSRVPRRNSSSSRPSSPAGTSAAHAGAAVFDSHADVP